jgi:hypothetical protein
MATFWTKSDSDSLGKDLDTFEKLCATFDTKVDLLVGRKHARVGETGGHSQRGGGVAGHGSLSLKSTSDGEHGWVLYLLDNKVKEQKSDREREQRILIPSFAVM